MDFKNEFTSKGAARNALIYSILIVVVYKGWKYALTSGFNLNPVTDYRMFESMATLYRMVGTAVGLVLIRRCYSGGGKPLKIGNDFIFILNILILVPLYFYLRTRFFTPTIRVETFSWDLFFNLFTGSFEEILFRGLMFASLSYFTGVFRGALLSSLAFMVWHLDVTLDPGSLIFIFLFAMYASYAFSLNASLLSLSLFHFLWDQVRYGIEWSARQDAGGYQFLLNLFSTIAVVMILMAARQLKLNSKSVERG